jgi:6-phosphogluconate dehydrogenase
MVTPAGSLDELVSKLQAPRVIWMALPAGEPTNHTATYLEHLFQSGDILCDAGNSHFNDSKMTANRYQEKGLHFLDVGISGGIEGRENGFCLMVGGAEEAVMKLSPVWDSIAQEKGFAHVGPSGSGHYVKMVHNGIEYGYLQAYAEGIQLLAEGSQKGQLDLAQVGELWQHGSIIQSRIGEWGALALSNSEGLAALPTIIADNGEGSWALTEAVQHKVAVPVLAASVAVRHASQQSSGLAAKLITALRHAFGGHPTK